MRLEVQVRLDERVLVVSLDRPAKKNAITAPMYAQLAQALERAECDAGVHAVLIRGEGGNFTSGNDIGLFVGASDAPSQQSPADGFIHAVLCLSKPLIACVRGHAVGIGATILVHCDYVVASDDARLRFPFVDLGLCPEFASTLLLQKTVGRCKATEWLLLGSPVPAGEAHMAGLVNRVLPAAMAEEEALSVAKRFASKPQQALRATRELIRQAGHEPALARVARESNVFGALRRTPEAQAIFRRFLDRETQHTAARA